MRIIIIFSALLIAGSLPAQVGFKTIVPPQSVTAGESFQVQYIIEGGEQVTHFIAPVFTNFRVVTGPNIYMGTSFTLSGSKQLRNTVYTLEAIRPGQFVIPGAVATINGELLKSQDAIITVITPEEARKRLNRESGINSEYFLRPGEDPYRKISENLFMKVMVDKTECYSGEAVLATFKLYSRLESKSDIVKNPGFYGFSVEDIVNLADKFVSTENISGRVFDVHTIRKVRLFPLQAGIYTIDPMEVRNKVEFSRSAVYRKTEQQIVEGVLNNAEDEPTDRQADIYETEMRTAPVTIRVKPLPVAAKPADYNGAVGHFSVSMSLSDSVISKNQPAYLDIRLSGEGNFIQLDAPEVSWPSGVEGFAPKVIDETDKSTGHGGSRVFRYAFLSSSAGEYDIPAINFSFFNPDSGRYQTLHADGKHLRVSNEMGIAHEVIGSPVQKRKSDRSWILPAIVLLLIVSIVIWVWIIQRRKETKKAEPEAAIEPVINIDELLAPALRQESDQFYYELRKGIFEFFVKTYSLSGSGMGKEHIQSVMRNEKLDESIISEILDLLDTCDAGVFTKATLTDDKVELVKRTETLLSAIQRNSL